LAILGILSQDKVIQVSISYDDVKQSYILTEGIFVTKGHFIAAAKYTKSLETKGWDLLAIQTNNFFDDLEQAEAAGYLEGYLTGDRIWNHYRNMRFKTQDKKDVEFLNAQEKWLEDSFKTKQTDPIIYNAYLTLKQLNGLRRGYNENVRDELKIRSK
jgi:hypothetical protein